MLFSFLEFCTYIMYTVYGHVNHTGFISFEGTVKRYKSHFTCSGSRAILDLNF